MPNLFSSSKAVSNTQQNSRTYKMTKSSSVSLSNAPSDATPKTLTTRNRTQSAYTRNLTAIHINEFLHNRPSTYVLIKNNLVQNTMTWSIETIKGPPPSERNCHTASVIDDKMFILGGYVGSYSDKNSIECFILDFDKMAWEKTFVAGSVPIERYSHTCVSVGTNLVVFGGFSVYMKWLNDVCVLDTKLKQRFIPSLCSREENSACVEEISMLFWYRPDIKGTPPSPRAAASAVTVGTCIYYFGGNDGNQFFNDFHVLDLDKMEWKEIPLKGDFPSPRAGHTATLVDNNQMIIFGGGVENGYSNEIFFLNLESMVWTAPKIEGTSPCPRAGHTAITILNKTAVLVFGGGFGEKVFGDLHMFDIEMCKWTRPSDAGYLPQARAGHSCVSVSNIAYFFGGADGDSHVFNDVHSLDTAFLVLKNLSQEKGDELKYIKNVELSPMKNFTFFKEKCQDDLEQLDQKLDQMVLEQKNFHECNNFILRELSKRLEDNNSERVKALCAIKKELKKHREELFIRKDDPAPLGFAEAARKPPQPKQPEPRESGGLKAKNGGMVKNVCTLFESIAIDNFNSIARKKNSRGGKKKRG